MSLVSVVLFALRMSLQLCSYLCICSCACHFFLFLYPCLSHHAIILDNNNRDDDLFASYLLIFFRLECIMEVIYSLRFSTEMKSSRCLPEVFLWNTSKEGC